MLKSFYSSINEKSKGGQKEIFYDWNNKYDVITTWRHKLWRQFVTFFVFSKIEFQRFSNECLAHGV